MLTHREAILAEEWETYRLRIENTLMARQLMIFDDDGCGQHLPIASNVARVEVVQIAPTSFVLRYGDGSQT